jgi:nucleoside-diphosphate-sugar epimerase
MATAIGAQRPWKLPRWLVSLVAPYMIAFGMDTQMRVSNAKAKAELGWRPRYPSYREGIEAMARALRAESLSATRLEGSH